MSATVSPLRAGGAARPTNDRGLRFQILGSLRLWRDGTELEIGPPQQSYLLALLLAREGRLVSTADLIDLIWEDDAPSSALNVVHKYIGALRRLLEPSLPPRGTGSYLLRRGNGYLLAAGASRLDLTAFRALIRTADVSRAAGHRADALDRYVDALRLWHGSTSDALVGGTAASSIATALDGEFYDACAAAAELAIALGQPGRVLSSLRMAAGMAPLHEPVQAGLVTALAADGQQAEALSVFRGVRTRLAEDLGIDPGRVLQEAQRRVLDQTAAATPIAPPAPFDVRRTAAIPPVAQLPPDLPTFVGRSAELTILSDLLATGRTVIALAGPGGVGKSALAARFAHQVADEFPDGQLYLDLTDPTARGDRLSPDRALHGLLCSLGVPEPEIPAALDARVGLYRTLTAGKRVLVLLNDATDAAQVRPLIPSSAHCLVLVTSRAPLIGLAVLDGAHLMHVDLPDRTSARELIRRRLDRSPDRAGTNAPKDTATLDEIVELCGRLPLALAALAGRLSARPRLSLEAVAAELRSGPLRAFPTGDGLIDPRSAFAWSYQSLSPEAARLFRLFSATPATGITVAACASLGARSLPVTGQLLSELVDAGLIDECDRGLYSAHVLAKAYGEELLLATGTDACRDAAVTRLLRHYLHSCHLVGALLAPPSAPDVSAGPPPGVIAERPRSYAEAVRWLEAHREVLRLAVRLAAEAEAQVTPWQLALALGPSLRSCGRVDDWEEIMTVCLRAARSSGDRIGEAHVRRSLADARRTCRAGEGA
ncbi:AfsR/SARP family transcriptional regulator [Cryptosporangium phraense]|uniref:Transcriptional regulator, SARP family protein n=1 Tax=Cryptosporangium phraense TaxID=2593070 RepID=A0A545AY04_9ACTN|nr:BTAD domain-containing putative transcriptional regulator [Cryptosporangium phraense]TQS46212.1 transcriptional regulator, SARP family protein [Cryptosporangium phraense]